MVSLKPFDRISLYGIMGPDADMVARSISVA